MCLGTERYTVRVRRTLSISIRAPIRVVTLLILRVLTHLPSDTLLSSRLVRCGRTRHIAQDQDSSADFKRSDDVESCRRLSSLILQPANDEGSDRPRETPHGVDERNTTGSGTPGQQHRRKLPERGPRAHSSSGSNGERRERKQ